MNRRRAITTFLFAGAASSSLCSKRSYGARDSEEPNYTIHSDVRLVLLDVSVTDAHGSPVSRLPKESFRVIENSQSQHITVFDNTDVPVTVGLLVDESRSMSPKRAEVLTAAEIFIGESNPLDEIFVLNFNDTVRRGLPDRDLFSGNLTQLRAALYRGRAEGKTALNDALVTGIKQLKEGRREKKTLVVISDGGDNASTHTREQMIGAVEGSLATIYTIGLFDEDDPDRNPGVLKKLAAISGGQAYFPTDTAAMIPTCRKIARDIRSRYTIGYIPQENGKALRRIQVYVTALGHKALHARTRAAYRY